MDLCSRLTTARLRAGARILVNADSRGVELPRVIHPGVRAATVQRVDRVLGERGRIIVTDLGDVRVGSPSQEVTVACGQCDRVAVDGDPAGDGAGGLCEQHGGVPHHVRTLPGCNRTRVEANGLEPLPYPAGWEAWGAERDPYAPAPAAEAEPADLTLFDVEPVPAQAEPELPEPDAFLLVADAPAPRRVELAAPVQLRTYTGPDADEAGTLVLDVELPPTWAEQRAERLAGVELVRACNATKPGHLYPAAAGECPEHAAPELVVIPCGGRKADEPAPAGQLYTGSYHRAARRAADALSPARILILSARHGLVELDTVLAPYEQRMGEPGSVTVEQLRDQAERLGVLGAHDVIALAGESYAAPLRAVWPMLVEPLAGSRGIGDHLSRLAAIRAAGTLTLPYSSTV